LYLLLVREGGGGGRRGEKESTVEKKKKEARDQIRSTTNPSSEEKQMYPQFVGLLFLWEKGKKGKERKKGGVTYVIQYNKSICPLLSYFLSSSPRGEEVRGEKGGKKPDRAEDGT